MSDSDRQDIKKRLRAANYKSESDKHLWGKAELLHRKRNEIDPWFPGTYHFEQKLADRVPDCHVNGALRRVWIEFVVHSDQPYRVKTRHALRLGFDVYWVFHVDHCDRIEDAKQALSPELQSSVEFGVFDPSTGQLSLGDPITFDNYEFRVQSLREFDVEWINGYRGWSCEYVQPDGFKIGGFLLGEFEIAGHQCRVYSVNPMGSYYRVQTPSPSPVEAFLTDLPAVEYPDQARKWFPGEILQEVINRWTVTRVGPAKGSRRYD